jgi:hypothetical protein
VFSSCKHAGMTGNMRKNLFGLYCKNTRVNAWKTRNIGAEEIRKINILPHSSPDCGSEVEPSHLQPYFFYASRGGPGKGLAFSQCLGGYLAGEKFMLMFPFLLPKNSLRSWQVFSRVLAYHGKPYTCQIFK